MTRILSILLLLLISHGVFAKALDLSAFPKLPHAVEDACWIGDRLYLLTANGIFEATSGDRKWDIQPIARQGPQETMWSLACADVSPEAGIELVVSRVRNGVWRSFILVSADGGWRIARDGLPFAFRRVTWQGQWIWAGDARFLQAGTHGEFFQIETSGDDLKIGAKIRLPRGSTLDNWMQLPSGDVAVLRDRHVEFFGDAQTGKAGPHAQHPGRNRWRLKGRSPGGGLTTLCAESQPSVFSSVGAMACRRLAPSLWDDILIVPHNKLVMDQVLGRVPMIDHGEIGLLVWDKTLEGYQFADRIGPFPGELASYFIDKNPRDGRDTLFLVVQIRSEADAVGGLTHNSVLIPVALESLLKSNAK